MIKKHVELALFQAVKIPYSTLQEKKKVKFGLTMSGRLRVSKCFDTSTAPWCIKKKTAC